MVKQIKPQLKKTLTVGKAKVKSAHELGIAAKSLGVA